MQIREELKQYRERLRMLDETLQELRHSYHQAKRELGETTMQDIERAHRNGLLSTEQSDTFKSSVGRLQVTVNTHPAMIDEYEMEREILLTKIRRLEDNIDK